MTAHDHHHDHDCCGHDHHHDHPPAGPTVVPLSIGGARAAAHDLGTHAAEDLICLQNVSYRYPGRKADGGDAGGGVVALKDVTLHVNRGENLGIIGPNGAGKTTLLKILLGMLDGFTGNVSILGMSPREAIRRGGVIGYVPQRANVDWQFPISAEQVVMMGLTGKTGLFHWHSRTDKEYARNIMDRVGILPLKDRPIGELSGGQQQRCFIARALASRPPILILDEPLVGIDEAGQQQFAKFIHELHESLQLTVIIVSHDLQAIAAGCNRVACLKQSIHYHAAPAGLTKEVLTEVFNHEIAPVLLK